MALKRKITKADYDKLSDVLKFEYKAGSKADEFVLDVDDATDLINARDAANRERDTFKTENATLKAENTALKATNGNWDTLEASYKSQIAAKDAEIATTNEKLTGLRRTHHTSADADKIASRFSVPGLVKDKILSRLDIKTDKDGNVSTVVLDKDGKISALTIDDLTKEFVDNPEYKPIVLAHKGSGSAGAGLPVVPGNNADPNAKPKLIHNQTPEQIAADRKARKEAANANAGT